MYRITRNARLSIIGTALTLATPLGVQHAIAETDWKVHAATQCVANNNAVFYDNAGGICNNSNSDVTIACPVTREYATGRFPIHIRHSGRSGNTQKGVECTFRNLKTVGTAHNGSGSIYAYFATLSALPANDGGGYNAAMAVRHVHTDLERASIGSADYGANVISCTLPASNVTASTGGEPVQVFSCLYNYSAHEWNGK